MSANTRITQIKCIDPDEELYAYKYKCIFKIGIQKQIYAHEIIYFQYISEIIQYEFPFTNMKTMRHIVIIISLYIYVINDFTV